MSISAVIARTNNTTRRVDSDRNDTVVFACK